MRSNVVASASAPEIEASPECLVDHQNDRLAGAAPSPGSALGAVVVLGQAMMRDEGEEALRAGQFLAAEAGGLKQRLEIARSGCIVVDPAPVHDHGGRRAACGRASASAGSHPRRRCREGLRGGLPARALSAVGLWPQPRNGFSAAGAEHGKHRLQSRQHPDFRRQAGQAPREISDAARHADAAGRRSRAECHEACFASVAGLATVSKAFASGVPSARAFTSAGIRMPRASSV